MHADLVSDGSKHALDRGLRHEDRVLTSSVAVYGFTPIDINESGAIAPCEDYDRTTKEAGQVYDESRKTPGGHFSLKHFAKPTIR